MSGTWNVPTTLAFVGNVKSDDFGYGKFLSAARLSRTFMVRVSNSYGVIGGSRSPHRSALPFGLSINLAEALMSLIICDVRYP